MFFLRLGTSSVRTKWRLSLYLQRTEPECLMERPVSASFEAESADEMSSQVDGRCGLFARIWKQAQWLAPRACS